MALTFYGTILYNPVQLSGAAIHLYSHTDVVVSDWVKSDVSSSYSMFQDVHNGCKVITIAAKYL